MSAAEPIAAAHHTHHHGPVDATLLSSKRGIWAIQWAFVGLMVTALLQVVIVWISGSVALLADTIHNLGDATTSVPLWIAFTLSRRQPDRQFTYGLGRVEDLAGVVIVLTILFSAGVAAYESILRLLHPQDISHLGWVAAASIVGFVGNEAVALFRIKVGREIGSAALVADGYHARVDGFTSLAVLGGALGVWLGYPLADPIVGLLITAAILKIVWDSSKLVFTRLLDGVEPEVIDAIERTAAAAEGVRQVTEVRCRWIGHRMHAEVNIEVAPDLTVAAGHQIAKQVHQRLLEALPYLAGAIIHVDPLGESGERHHHAAAHQHDGSIEAQAHGSGARP